MLANVWSSRSEFQKKRWDRTSKNETKDVLGEENAKGGGMKYTIRCRDLRICSIWPHDVTGATCESSHSLRPSSTAHAQFANKSTDTFRHCLARAALSCALSPGPYSMISLSSVSVDTSVPNLGKLHRVSERSTASIHNKHWCILKI